LRLTRRFAIPKFTQALQEHLEILPLWRIDKVIGVESEGIITLA
jgi:hypothetical protein